MNRARQARSVQVIPIAIACVASKETERVNPKRLDSDHSAPVTDVQIVP